MAHQTKELIDFHLRVQKSVTAIMKDGKIDQNDIPEIMLLITELLISPTSPKMTVEELAEKINELYEYIMTHYKLFPEDERQKEQFKRLFDMCVKLVLVQPNIKKAYKNCFSCLV
jgi:hypothetical protein